MQRSAACCDAGSGLRVSDDPSQQADPPTARTVERMKPEAAMWTRDIPLIDPVAAAARLAALPGLAFLDSAMHHDTLGRISVVAADPFARFRCRDGASEVDGVAVEGTPLEALRSFLAPYRDLADKGFAGGAIGYFAYDLGQSLERVMPPARRAGLTDDIAFNLYDTVLVIDHEAQSCRLEACGFPERTSGAREARAGARLERFASLLADVSQPISSTSPQTLAWRSNFTRQAYENAVEKVQDYIRAGDIYQANIAQRFTASLPPGFDAFALYGRLRETNPATFGAYLAFESLRVASSSPERFLKLDGRHVETRPIKGTVRRVADLDADRSLAEALQANPKERAENIMIVDLLRNDLSRICEPHSVRVPTLCGLETYASVHHLVSVVTGTLREGADAVDLIAATFPGGSITGAPKLRAMDIITEIEGDAREPLLRRDRPHRFRRLARHLHRHPHRLHEPGDRRAPGGRRRHPAVRARPRIRGDAHQGGAGLRRLRGARMILVLDNYDSFVFNVVRYFEELGQRVHVARNDALDVDGIRALAPEALVISPGPCTPAEAGVTLAAIDELSGKLPILGVCLGHQAIGAAFGGVVERARQPLHGQATAILHHGERLFAGLSSPMRVGRYHSLIVAPRPGMERQLIVDATSSDGEVMALSHRSHPTYGIQFHPESVLTEHGHAVFSNFLALAAAWRSGEASAGTAVHALA